MATLQEVAKEAGVSITTVSRVLNNSTKVNGKTRARVQKAVRSLGYQPSRVARRLRVQNGRAHLLGLVIPDIQNPFYSKIVRGVEDVAYKHDYALILCNSDEDAEKERFYLEALRAESVDGIILPPIQERGQIVAALAEAGLPIVCVDRRMEKIIVDTVVVDNRQGAREAVNLLLDLGHRRVGLISGSPNYSSMKERQEGYEQALREHGLGVDGSLIDIGDLRQNSGRTIAERMLGIADPPTAFFVVNNLMTMGAMEAVYDRGLRIPDDIAIIGFDDMPWANLVNPPLTVIRQPGYEMGRRAAEMLFQRLSDPGRDPALVMLQPELVVRSSCGSKLAAAS